MIIGIPCEVKRDEYRVAVLPVGVQLLTGDGHKVLLQKGNILTAPCPHNLRKLPGEVGRLSSNTTEQSYGN